MLCGKASLSGKMRKKERLAADQSQIAGKPGRIRWCHGETSFAAQYSGKPPENEEND